MKGNRVTVTRTSGKPVAQTMARASHAVETAVPRSLGAAVDLSEKMLNTAIVTMVGGDMRMRNVKSRRLGAKGGVRRKGKGGQAAVGPVGPVPLIDQGAPSHVIGVGRQSSAKRSFSFPGVTQGYGVRRSRDITLGRKRKVLSWTDGGRRTYRMAPLFHPGFTGKNRWVPVRDGPLARSLPKVMAFPVTRAFASAVRGG